MYTTKSGRHMGCDRQGGIRQRVPRRRADGGQSAGDDTFIFNAGVELNTPALEEERDGLMPPWKYEASYD